MQSVEHLYRVLHDFNCSHGFSALAELVILVHVICVYYVLWQLVGILISAIYYVLRKKEIQQQMAMIIDDMNAQTMTSLAQRDY